MSTLTTYGGLNGHMLGLLMKELARRAIQCIRLRRMGFTEFAKESNRPEKKGDLYTDADVEAQQIYLKSLRECTPQFGVVAEEGYLRSPCTHPTADIYWTVDPMDGTRAFSRRQSHGIGTMLSLVCDKKVVAAVVGDVMTQELYYFRPGSDKVHRIHDFSDPEQLQIDDSKSLGQQYLLLRDPPEAGAYSLLSREMATGDLFGGYQTSDGSIGSMMARLWKGEVGAVILPPGEDTPWDFCPVLGLSQQLGFVFLEVTNEGMLVEGVELKPPMAIPPEADEFRKRENDLLIIHRSRLQELRDWWGHGR